MMFFFSNLDKYPYAKAMCIINSKLSLVFLLPPLIGSR